jgi:DNA-directed RNA polymerase subunit RPC12/RpoP
VTGAAGGQTGEAKPTYVCGDCGRPFEASESLLTLLPLLVPQRCSACADRPRRMSRSKTDPDRLSKLWRIQEELSNITIDQMF